MKYVKFVTSMGEMYIELDEAKAPISVENFLSYVDEGFYAGTVFHRVISGFVIQGGGFDSSKRQKKTKAPIKNEWKNGLKNLKYTLSMARTNVADSATSQFFVNLVDNAFLDQARDGAAYAVFGKVVRGQGIVDQIGATATDSQDWPRKDIVVTSAARCEASDLPAA